MNFDKEALGRLWDETTPKLFGYLVNVTRNKALAEDLLQNTWLKAIEALPRYRDRGLRMSSWLFAIARNECLQHFRKAGRVMRVLRVLLSYSPQRKRPWFEPGPNP